MKPAPETQTIEITNFSGRLTRILNGDLNSGFAKFAPSFGYDPFTKPMNLTWLETPTSIAGITGLPQAAKVFAEPTTNGPNVHVIDQGGKWYQINSASNLNSNLNSVIAITSLVSTTFIYGTSMEFFGSIIGTDAGGISLPKLYFSGDDRISSINPDSSGEATVGSVASYGASQYRPLKSFAGSLIFGNGPTIGKINNTGMVTSSVLNVGTGNQYSELNPGLGTLNRVIDLEPSVSNDYITMATTTVSRSEDLSATLSDFNQAVGSAEGKLFLWNGSDLTATAATSIPSYFISAIKTYFRNIAFFAADTFGMTFNNGVEKIISLPNNRAPMTNAISTNGNFMTWACPEVDSTNRYMSLYYFGSLDQENPKGLYRLLRWTAPLIAGTTAFVNKVPLNVLVSNFYKTVNGIASGLTTLGFGKHYIGLTTSRDGINFNKYLLSFLVTSSGTGTPQLGVYETQTQLFSKRVNVTQIRVYTEPTVTNNGFQLDMIGSDGTIITGGTFNFTHGDANLADPNSGSTALERINFNPNVKTQYALGIRITNTGTANMTIKKIEVDYTQEGK